MTEIEMKYGFPLFAKPTSIVSLGKNEKIVISDIWAFWDYVVKKASKGKGSKVFLKSLLEQARNFYIAAESSPTQSKPLLYYYSFLNFSKILINLTGAHGPSKTYMHGMKERHNNKFLHSEITKEKQKTNVVQVAHELVSGFDPTITNADLVLKVRDLLNHCIGVHQAYSEIYSQREVFFRLHDLRLYKNGKELIFKSEVKCTVTDIPSLVARGYGVTHYDDKIYYELRSQIGSNSPTRMDYAQLTSEIQRKGIWYFVGNSGYTAYLSNSTVGRYSQESIIYMGGFKFEVQQDWLGG